MLFTGDNSISSAIQHALQAVHGHAHRLGVSLQVALVHFEKVDPAFLHTGRGVGSAPPGALRVLGTLTEWKGTWGWLTHAAGSLHAEQARTFVHKSALHHNPVVGEPLYFTIEHDDRGRTRAVACSAPHTEEQQGSAGSQSTRGGAVVPPPPPHTGSQGPNNKRSNTNARQCSTTRSPAHLSMSARQRRMLRTIRLRRKRRALADWMDVDKPWPWPSSAHASPAVATRHVPSAIPQMLANARQCSLHASLACAGLTVPCTTHAETAVGAWCAMNWCAGT